jgi:hypothetical protein
MTLLADLLSRDPQRVWAASGAVIRETDDEVLAELASHLPQIEEHTAGLDLGGALFPNSEHLRQALRVLEAVQGDTCRCQLYPPYLFYNPRTEAQAGHVRILASDIPEENLLYHCECRICGAWYLVEEGESHYTWWQWTEI